MLRRVRRSALPLLNLCHGNFLLRGDVPTPSPGAIFPFPLPLRHGDELSPVLVGRASFATRVQTMENAENAISPRQAAGAGLMVFLFGLAATAALVFLIAVWMPV